MPSRTEPVPTRSETPSPPTMANTLKHILQQLPPQAFPITLVLGLLLLFFLKRIQKKSPPRNPCPPAVPGLPVIGNLLQLKEKKPYQTFTRWAEVYGPIYSIKTGATTLVVLNTTKVVKEAMVTRYSSICTRRLSNALKILTSDKCMVATSDYNEFHKTTKRYLLSGVLGVNAQKRFRVHRDTMMDNMVQKLHTFSQNKPGQALNLRSIFQHELFGLALKQTLGKDLEAPIYVEELGTELSRQEIFEVLVIDPMMGAIDVDWRDFFPYLRWIPNKTMEMKIELMNKRRNAVMKALVREQKKRIASGEVLNSYVDFLLSSDAKNLTENELNMLFWEPTIETSDTTLVTTEWAMYELAKNPSYQDRLYHEIRSVCGSDEIKEEHFPQLPFLNAIFHETLRRHSPVPIVPLRYVHEDTQLGGYHIPAGTEIAINIYGCNMDKNQWDEPEKWKPERFLSSNFDPADMYKTMAFGAGKRVCAGSLQAMTISCMAIGTFVQEFHWSLKEGQKDNISTLGLTTHRFHPLLAYVTPRKC